MCQKVLCTFSGKFGDILFALATVKEIAKKHEQSVDFVCMPHYRSLLPLVRMQEYICHAETEEDWRCTGSPFGDQPWQPPRSLELGREKFYHLTYRHHPSQDGLTLADAIARNGEIVLSEKPWMDVPRGQWKHHRPLVSWAFNDEETRPQKLDFIWKIRQEFPELCFVGVDWRHVPDWIDAAQIIKESLFFLGDLSSLHVLAHALGKRCLIYEPNLDRRVTNYRTYQYRFGTEVVPDISNYEMFVRTINEWREANGNTESNTRRGRGQAYNSVSQVGCLQQKKERD